MIVAGFVAVLAAVIWLPQLRRDPSAEAFIAPDDPALVCRTQVKQTFGLSDPIVVVIIDEGSDGIFNPHTLGLVWRLTDQIRALDGVDPQRVVSLATRDDIVGTDAAIVVIPFLDEPPATCAQAARIRSRVMNCKLCLGNLVSRQGDATLISAELADQDLAAQVYDEVTTMLRRTLQGQAEVHVTGEGAISARLGAYIDADMVRLNGLCAIVIRTVLLVAYRTARGIFLPLLIVAGAVAVALGLMATANVPFYIITNALPVILIAMGVADGVYILGQYYQMAARDPDADNRKLVVASMVLLWRPVTITSVTDTAAFGAIFLVSAMPPMKAFGLFAAIGSTAALVVALGVLPAVLVLLARQSSRAFGRPAVASDLQAKTRVDWLGQLMASGGSWVR